VETLRRAVYIKGWPPGVRSVVRTSSFYCSGESMMEIFTPAFCLPAVEAAYPPQKELDSFIRSLVRSEMMMCTTAEATDHISLLRPTFRLTHSYSSSPLSPLHSDSVCCPSTHHLQQQPAIFSIPNAVHSRKLEQPKPPLLSCPSAPTSPTSSPSLLYIESNMLSARASTPLPMYRAPR
jgi:hypothetical protein